MATGPRHAPRVRTFHRPRSDDGFTLLELLISIMILGLILTALVGAFFVAGQSTQSTNDRLDESRDIQVTASVFSQDVQGANSFTSGAGPRCGRDPGSANVIELLGGSFTTTALPTLPPVATPPPPAWPNQYVIAYVTRTVSVDGKPATELHRLTCMAGPNATPSSDRVLARELSSTTVPRATCFTVNNSPVGCAAPQAVTVKLTLTPMSGDSSRVVTLVAHRRTT